MRSISIVRFGADSRSVCASRLAAVGPLASSSINSENSALRSWNGWPTWRSNSATVVMLASVT